MRTAALVAALGFSACADAQPNVSPREAQGPEVEEPRFPQDPDGHLERGQDRWRRISVEGQQPSKEELLSIIGDKDKALEGGTSRRVEALKTLAAVLQTLLAQSHDSSGEFKKQLKSTCRELLAVASDDVKALVTCLPHTDEKSERWTEAFQKVVASQPHNAEAHRMLARTLASEGRLEEALVHARSAVEHAENPELRAGYRADLISLLRAAGRTQEAAEEEKKIFEGQ